MGIYKTQSLCAGRLIDDLSEMKSDETLVCHKDKYLVTALPTIKLNSRWYDFRLSSVCDQVGVIDIEDKTTCIKYADVDVIKLICPDAFQQVCPSGYTLYYVHSTYYSFDESSREYYIECKEFKDLKSKKRHVLFELLYKQFLQKEKRRTEINSEINKLLIQIEAYQKELLQL